MNAIRLKGVNEKYNIKFIKEGQISWEEVLAVKDVNLAVKKGETLGVIGQNGSGKTTLLKLIAGMLMPDTGSIDIFGKVSTLMELGAGFNPEFTGRENIVVNSKIYGLGEDALKQAMDKIIEFADLGRFIDAPIKYYSQGMYMRLAFALAIFVEPDILLIDDILAVGDQEAQQKCVQKIFELKNQGKTIVIISHDMTMINRLCDRVILFEHGQVVQEGSAVRVVPYYMETIGDKNGVAILKNQGLRVVFNNGRITVSYNGSQVTKGRDTGVYFYQDSFDLWLASFNLVWKIKEFRDHMVIAEGSDSGGKILQCWTLQIEGDKLQWQVETKEESIRNTHLNLFLDSRYKEWGDLNKTRTFPGFTHKTNWQEIESLPYSETLLSINPDNPQTDPHLLIATDTVENRIKILNSGYEQEARVVQFISNKNIVSINIRFFTQRSESDKYLEDARKTITVRKQQEHNKDILLNSIVSGPLRLFADTENKSLRIYYKDKEITRGDGLHVSILSNKVWHNTSESEWQVAKEGDILYLKFSWAEPKFLQISKLQFQTNVLVWQNDSELSKDSTPDTLKFGLCVCSDYKGYFCGHELNEFPEEFSYWQNMSLENERARYFGLRIPEGFPAIAFDNPTGASCLIQNGDSQNHFRVLQLIIPGEMLAKKVFNFSTLISFLEEESFITDYLKEEQEKILIGKQKELEMQRALATIDRGNIRLYADTENKILQLYYKNKEITNDNGLYSSFRLSQEHAWFLFKDAQWDMQKISDSEIILKFDYPLVTQIWKCTCIDDNTLEVAIELEIKKPVSLANHEVRIELKDIFERWRTTSEDGDFSVVQYVNNIGPIRLKNSKVDKVILETHGAPETPALSFETSFPERKQILGIYKANYPHANNTCLNFALIIPKKEEQVVCGRYKYFVGKIAFNDAGKIEGVAKKSLGAELKSNGLRFLFEQGTGRLFLDNQELTSGLGVYTSVRSSGIWYDSYQASWEVSHLSRHKIVALGNWPYIPISQQWSIELVEEGLIYFKVDMEIFEDTYFEIEQTNIMLINQYTSWEIPQASKGEFSDEYTQDYDILPYRFWYGKLNQDGILVNGSGLPLVVFKSSLGDDRLKILVENTDYVHKARLVQYQRCNTDKLPKGKYTYFSGVIKIGPEK